MKLLYLTPTYNSQSEVWQQRHIEMLKGHIFCIATILANERKWNNEIPIVNLSPEAKLSTKIRKYLSTKNKNETTINNQIAGLIKKSEVVFVQYLSFAERFMETLNNSSKPIFVHTHGFDVTWDLTLHDNPDENKHGANYVHRVQQFKDHVHFIANSKDTQEKLMSIGISEAQIHLKYLGTEIYPERPSRKASEDFNLLFLGRLVDFKGPDMVIEAFEMACGQGLTGNLIIAGDGPLRATCELMKRKSKFGDRIQLLGSVSKEKGDALRENANIFIAHNCKGLLSGQEEAFGVSVIEAMEAQIPVISAASAGVKETVVHNETGLLNEPFDVKKQAEHILYLYNNPDIAQKMGLAGRERVVTHFSFEKERDTFLKILNSKKIK